MQVQELQLPVSALTQYQHYLAWHGGRSAAPKPAPLPTATAPAVAAAGASRSGEGQHTSVAQTDIHWSAPQQHQINGIEIIPTADPEVRKPDPPFNSLLQLLLTHMPQLNSISLHMNAILQPSALGNHLQQLLLVPQITALKLCDSCSWGMPCNDLTELTVLTHLRKLQWLVQSPGMPQSVLQAQPPFPPAASAWQQRVGKSFQAIHQLTGLQHLQLRFVCGERGELRRSLIHCMDLDLYYLIIK